MNNYLKVVLKSDEEDIIIDGSNLTFVYNRAVGLSGNPEGLDQFQVYAKETGALLDDWNKLRVIEPNNIAQIEIYENNIKVWNFTQIKGITYSVQFWETTTAAAKDNIIFMMDAQ